MAKEDQILKNNLIKNVLSSEHRLIIFRIVTNPDNKKNLTILNIHKALCFLLKNDFDYKNTYKHIKILERSGLIKLNKHEKEQGKPIHVSLSNNKYRILFNNILKIINPELLLLGGTK